MPPITRNRVLTVAALLMAVHQLAYGQDTASTIPPAIDGSGFDVLGWAVSKFGWLGLAMWISWQARGIFSIGRGLSGIPVQVTGPIVIEIHQDTMNKFMKRVKQEHLSDETSTEPDTKPKKPTQQWVKP